LLSVAVVNAEDGRNDPAIQFKNPVSATESLRIDLQGDSSGLIRIMSLTGEVIDLAEFIPETSFLSFGNIKPGLYLVVYQSAVRKESYKLLVL
jgi:hypothetical protein